MQAVPAMLLEQAKDIYELERSYELLKTLKTDWEELAPVLLRLLFRHIGSYPQAPLADWVQLLGQKLTDLFTQERYNEYMQYHAPDIQSKRNATTLNDWEYAGWACAYNNWPIARLAFALEPGDLLTNIFNAPLPALPAENTLQYMVLEHLFRNGSGT